MFSQIKWLDCILQIKWRVVLLRAVRDSVMFLIDFDHADFIQTQFQPAVFFFFLT